jgi:Domain of unknown function (DUF4129)
MRPGLRSRECRALLSVACALAIAPTAWADSGPHPRTVAEYRKHLGALTALIAACREHTDAPHCKAADVGTDDLVSTPSLQEPRLASYGWLRQLFTLVADRKLSAVDAGPQLDAAAARMRQEQAETPGAVPSAQADEHAGQHSALVAILDRREFRRADPNLIARALDAIAIWTNRQLSGLAQYSAHRRWMARLLEWALVGLACLGLALWFVQTTRRARGLHLDSEKELEHAEAVRGWERLRQDAEQAASERRWRDAVRAYYWAVIARLESRGQWATDQARTPRESVLLLRADHPKREDLLQLTHRFEACWYGSAAATERDCAAARQLFDRLMAR